LTGMRKAVFIISFISAIIILGLVLEDSHHFSLIKDNLQNLTIPSPHLNFGKRGHLMRQYGLDYMVPEDYSNFFNPETGEFRLKHMIKLDTTKGLVLKEWTTPDGVSPDKLPSTLIMKPADMPRNVTVISIVADKEDLYSEKKGIFTNANKKGREWERPAFISYYQNRKLVFATGVGIRVHGGGVRKAEVKSLRFYFRDIYGLKEIESELIFNRKTIHPLKRFVLRKEPNFYNALAFDISEKLGCRVPMIQIVRVFLNGELYGDRYAMTEHLSKDYLYSNFGHTDYVFVRSKPEKVRRPLKYKQLLQWANDENESINMLAAEKYVNIKNLSLWWISQIFTANTSIYQGVALLDQSDHEKKWFWVNWDMDNAVRNKDEKEKEIWKQDFILRKLFNNRYHRRPRAVIFRRLMNEDPQYRRYFGQLLANSLNHLLTVEFLNSRIDYYENIDRELDLPTDYHEDSRRFFRFRAPFTLKLMEKHFNLPSAYSCSVSGPDNLQYKVDGFSYSKPYRGWYFKDTPVQIQVNSDGGKLKVKYWLVNGEKIATKDNRIRYVVKADTVIKVIMENNRMSQNKKQKPHTKEAS
jgi:hypothetical protein